MIDIFSQLLLGSRYFNIIIKSNLSYYSEQSKLLFLRYFFPFSDPTFEHSMEKHLKKVKFNLNKIKDFFYSCLNGPFLNSIQQTSFFRASEWLNKVVFRSCRKPGFGR